MTLVFARRPDAGWRGIGNSKLDASRQIRHLSGRRASYNRDLAGQCRDSLHSHGRLLTKASRRRLCENSERSRAPPKFRALSPRRARKIAEILALRGYTGSLAKFSHSLDVKRTLQVAEDFVALEPSSRIDQGSQSG
jgi:hypothetical protein